ncbi:MAG: hypothetical protein JWQ80_721 [Massilia sp.]|nr:hypothetical protein [Massilia sp.]
MLCFTLAARAEPAPGVPAPSPTALQQATPPGQSPPDSALPLRARLDRDAIRAALAGLPEERYLYPRRHEVDTISATPLQAFSQDFAKARLPVCLHSEGLRNQPTFFLSGWIALPFVAVAKLRGVCR